MKFFRSFKFLFKNRRFVKYYYLQPLDYHWRRAAVAGSLMLLASPAVAAAYIPKAVNHSGPASTQAAQDDSSSPTVIPVLPQKGSAKDNGASGAAVSVSALTQPGGQTAGLAHQNIITTYFYVGEPADKNNGYIANAASAWDGQWQKDYGGVDKPSPRNGYLPAGFKPKENPFYIALPYDDLTDQGARKTTAGSCPNALDRAAANYSWCKNSWLKISHGSKTVYAQWEDVGPFEDNDTAYVFGLAAPKNQTLAHAGLDVSPAVRDYLGLQDVDRCSWQFVSFKDVPSGPWTDVTTTSKGYYISG